MFDQSVERRVCVQRPSLSTKGEQPPGFHRVPELDIDNPFSIPEPAIRSSQCVFGSNGIQAHFYHVHHFTGGFRILGTCIGNDDCFDKCGSP
jgi:hypothetical protein